MKAVLSSAVGSFPLNLKSFQVILICKISLKFSLRPYFSLLSVLGSPVFRFCAFSGFASHLVKSLGADASWKCI